MIPEFRGNVMFSGLEIKQLPKPSEMLAPLRRLQNGLQRLDERELRLLEDMCAGGDRIMRLRRERVLRDSDFSPRCVWAAPVGLSPQKGSAIEIGTAMSKMFLRFADPFGVGYFDQTELRNVEPVERVQLHTPNLESVQVYPHGCYEILFIPGYTPIAMLRLTIFFPEAWWDAAMLLKGQQYSLLNWESADLYAVCHQSVGDPLHPEDDATPQFIERRYQAVITPDESSQQWQEVERHAQLPGGDSESSEYQEEAAILTAALKPDNNHPVDMDETTALTRRLIETSQELADSPDEWRELSMAMGRFLTKLWHHAPLGPWHLLGKRGQHHTRKG